MCDFAEIEVDVNTIANAYGMTVEQFVDTISGSTHSAISEQWVANKLNGDRILGEQLEWDVVDISNELKFVTFVSR